MKRRRLRPLFLLAITRVRGGYKAQARVATKDGYVIFSTTVRRKHSIAGELSDPPKTAAIKSVLRQADEFTSSPQGASLVSSRAKEAIASTLAVREVVERAKDGDSEAVVGMVKLKQSPHKVVRKAVNAQRLFEE
jgi:hypothetical protein